MSFTQTKIIQDWTRQGWRVWGSLPQNVIGQAVCRGHFPNSITNDILILRYIDKLCKLWYEIYCNHIQKNHYGIERSMLSSINTNKLDNYLCLLTLIFISILLNQM